MKYAVAECDKCGKNIAKERYYHEIAIDFRTWVNDPNTNQSEMQTSMCRKTHSMYCNECYEALIENIQNFIGSGE